MKKLLVTFLSSAITICSACGCSAQDVNETVNTAVKSTDGDVINMEIVLTINDPTMLVNGTEQNIDGNGTVPVIVNDRTLLPVRAVIEAMGGNVEWDSNYQLVTLTKDGNTILLQIDSSTAYLNGTEHLLDSPPIIINDRTMLPIRFIAESLGFNVTWDAERESITITGSADNTLDEQTDSTVQNTITITVNGQPFSATLADNETAKAFYDMLPLTLEMDELNGNEKYYYLDDDLPSNSSPVDEIHTGDLMLYGSDCIVLFFDTFTTPYSYTHIGHIDNAEDYAAALEPGTVTITFEAN